MAIGLGYMKFVHGRRQAPAAQQAVAGGGTAWFNRNDDDALDLPEQRMSLLQIAENSAAQGSR